LKESFFEAVQGKATVSPHYRKTLCFACHSEGESYPLKTEDPVELCNSCHATGEIVGDIHPLRKIPGSITPPESWPTREGSLTCLTCHLAGHPEHEGSWKFLRGGPYTDRNDFCRNCHDPKPYSDRNPHADINRGEGCEFCHAVRPVPGKDTIETVKFIADPNILCLRCHAEEAHPADFEHTMVIDSERADTIDDIFPVYRGNKIVCATCHNPHIEEVENHKLRGELSGMMVCSGCHKY
jgi:predicted CXXCH cytochrome family protein